MKRRIFLKSMLSLAALAAAPIGIKLTEPEPDWLIELKTTGKLFKKTIILDKTFVVDDSLGDFKIHNCTFKTSDKFRDLAMVEVKPNGKCKQNIDYCFFMMPNTTTRVNLGYRGLLLNAKIPERVKI